VSFSADLSKFCHKEAPEKTNKIVRGVVIEIANRLISRSPVGDASYWQSPPPAGYVGGHFRHNWQYGFNSVPSSILEGVDNSAVARTMSGLPTNTGGVHSGWSKQAPQGVVGLVELEMPMIVRSVIG